MYSSFYDELAKIAAETEKKRKIWPWLAGAGALAAGVGGGLLLRRRLLNSPAAIKLPYHGTAAGRYYQAGLANIHDPAEAKLQLRMLMSDDPHDTFGLGESLIKKIHEVHGPPVRLPAAHSLQGVGAEEAWDRLGSHAAELYRDPSLERLQQLKETAGHLHSLGAMGRAYSVPK